jgi:hypothetical protein
LHKKVTKSINQNNTPQHPQFSNQANRIHAIKLESNGTISNNKMIHNSQNNTIRERDNSTAVEANKQNKIPFPFSLEGLTKP